MQCPTCDKQFDSKASDALPFCSQRCRLIDLGRWLDESQSIPATPDPDADERPEAPWLEEPRD